MKPIDLFDKYRVFHNMCYHFGILIFSVPKKRELILCSPEHLNRIVLCQKPSIVRYIGPIFHAVGKGKKATYGRSFLSVVLLQECVVFS